MSDEIKLGNKCTEEKHDISCGICGTRGNDISYWSFKSNPEHLFCEDCLDKDIADHYQSKGFKYYGDE